MRGPGVPYGDPRRMGNARPTPRVPAKSGPLPPQRGVPAKGSQPMMPRMAEGGRKKSNKKTKK